MAGSRQYLAEFLSKSLTENEKVVDEVLKSSFVDDFFSDTDVVDSTSTNAEKIKIAALDIGRYRPQDVEWKIERDHVIISGKHSARTDKGAEGSKFLRCIPIPDEVKPHTVTARFCVGDGLLVVEGTKNVKKKLTRKSSKTAYFDDSHFSVSVDLGDEGPTEVCLDLKPDYQIGFDTSTEANGIKLF